MDALTTDSPGPPPPLQADEVHLWLLDPEALGDDAVDRFAASLSPDEVSKAQRYRRPCDRRQSIVARGLLRHALSSYREVPPASWRFVLGEQGKPALAAGQLDRPLSFNVSHTAGCVAVAVCEGDRELGVDVEEVARDSDIDRIASRFFAPRELAQLRGLEEAAHRERFFAFWTLKEAYIKARGLGLTIPLKDFWFELGGEEARIGFAAELDDRPARWRFARRATSERHRLAVALATTGELRLRVVDFRRCR